MTTHQAKYIAHELTKRSSSDSVQKFAASLADAQVDLNPHQIDAALFAFRSPLSKGAILADEVGLGKTIEAGILLSQKWAERKRKLLIIVPASLRKQWNQELADKFFLPSVILEAASFKAFIQTGNLNPFNQEQIVICSYHFARKMDAYVKQTKWDLVIVDEAHRLRNVYKPTNRIANAIKDAISHAPKVLLTATPLQNSLLELFGLISIVDEYTFGDLKSFKSQFSTLRTEEDFAALRERLKPICQRTLRRQVLEYISYTNRIPITQEFVPSEDEQRLYDLVSGYLQKESLYALPSGQRQLMTLILRKLLASSTYAISGTLQALQTKLEDAAQKSAATPVSPEEVAPDFEQIDELEEEWSDEEEVSEEGKRYTPEELEAVQAEIESLKKFTSLANSIVKNSKGEVLITALAKGFAKAREMGAPEKAIIFTESTRTQAYLKQVLESTPYGKKIVLFNGSNNDPQSKQIYRTWLERHKDTDRVTGSPSADMRQALVDSFREEAIIMIATEAAAEGINLQFCSLVVNYDLPWNPQRIEQRIGRCHRYGQKYDVVVVNFLNKNNAADQRVYQLLSEKFKLFSGVFGASDEVLGSIESGIDFEKRIVEIYQTCRTPEQIEFNFNALQKDLEVQIDEKLSSTKQKLLENFDNEVAEKLRIGRIEAEETLNRYERWLWDITRFYLKPHADFSADKNAFTLRRNPFPDEPIHAGPYRAGRDVQDANLYRLGHPLAQRIVQACKDIALPAAEIRFAYNRAKKIISVLEPLLGKSGWMRVSSLTVKSFDVEDHLILTAVCDDGKRLDSDECHRLLSLSAAEVPLLDFLPNAQHEDALKSDYQSQMQRLITSIQEKNARYFETEMEKLEGWAGDLKSGLENELKEIDREIKEIKRAAQLESSLESKVAMHKRIKELEAKRSEKRWGLFEAQDAVDARKDSLISNIESQLKQGLTEREVMTFRWSLIKAHIEGSEATA